ncbi:MAG: protein-export chaperone SecB [Holosporaceae bacterium]|jgi:preprotein translocase subunit SecB|nr:protein-export chaperone SecB [Holosporaceae bacterium]
MANENKNEQFLGIVSQYTKDLSFESINPMSHFRGIEEQPQIDVQLKVDVEKDTANTGEQNAYKVSLMVNINAKLNEPMFILDLIYTGEFVLGKFPEEIMEPILYVECPRLLFPFVRCIVANTVSEGGFPAVFLYPINFIELYQEQRGALNNTLQ